ncbi:hypothetical protein AAVH_24888 [Aphelenchoides avenae]|nr:hypothetical protein AAVH_24888 [Aphelenchus avenae]
MTEHSAEFAKMQAQLLAKDVENSVLAQENDRLKRTLSDRNETLASMPSEMEHRSKELATMRKECTELKCSLDAKTREYDQLMPEYNKVKEEYIRLVPQVSCLK